MIHDTSSQYMLVHHPKISFWHSRDINSSCSKPTADKWVMKELWHEVRKRLIWKYRTKEDWQNALEILNSRRSTSTTKRSAETYGKCTKRIEGCEPYRARDHGRKFAAAFPVRNHDFTIDSVSWRKGN